MSYFHGFGYHFQEGIFLCLFFAYLKNCSSHLTLGGFVSEESGANLDMQHSPYN